MRVLQLTKNLQRMYIILLITITIVIIFKYNTLLK